MVIKSKDQLAHITSDLTVQSIIIVIVCSEIINVNNISIAWQWA